jgi:hypothetical protein
VFIQFNIAYLILLPKSLALLYTLVFVSDKRIQTRGENAVKVSVASGVVSVIRKLPNTLCPVWKNPWQDTWV